MGKKKKVWCWHMKQARRVDWAKKAEKLFPFDVYCAVIPNAQRVFCVAKGITTADDDVVFELQQMNGEVMRKDIDKALSAAFEKGREAR